MSSPVQEHSKKFAWICEFCFTTVPEGEFPATWKWIWQSAVCPYCDARVMATPGNYNVVKGGAYANGKQDPRPVSSSRGVEQAPTPCADPEHVPPEDRQWLPGRYKHSCPSCAHVSTIIVNVDPRAARSVVETRPEDAVRNAALREAADLADEHMKAAREGGDVEEAFAAEVIRNRILAKLTVGSLGVESPVEEIPTQDEDQICVSRAVLEENLYKLVTRCFPKHLKTYEDRAPVVAAIIGEMQGKRVVLGELAR